jgi:hypothetical protein
MFGHLEIFFNENCFQTILNSFHFSPKIQIITGVVLISWRQSVLQKQIDYGAKLGHVVLSLAKMELDNFFKNVMPVADYFDQSDILIAVSDHHSPNDKLTDFVNFVFFPTDKWRTCSLRSVQGLPIGRS